MQGLAQVLRRDIGCEVRRATEEIVEAVRRESAADREVLNTHVSSLSSATAAELRRLAGQTRGERVHKASHEATQDPATGSRERDDEMESLRAQAAHALEEASEARVELEVRRAGAARLRDEADKARADLEMVQAEAAHARKNAAASDNAHTMREELETHWREETESARAELERLRAEMRGRSLERSAATAAAEYGAAEAKSEAARLSGSVRDLERRLEFAELARRGAEHKLTEEEKRTHSELVESRNQTEHARGEAIRLRARVAELERRLQAAPAALEVVEGMRNDDGSRMAATLDSEEQSRARTETLTSLVQDLESQLGNAQVALKEADTLVRDGREARCELGKLQAELSVAHAQAARSQSEVEDLQAQLQSVEGFQAADALAMMRGKMEEALADSEYVRQQLHTAQASLQDRDSDQNDVLRNALEASRAESERFRSTEQDLQRRLRNTQTELDNANIEAVRLGRVVQDLQESLDRANQTKRNDSAPNDELAEARKETEDVRVEIARQLGVVSDLQQQLDAARAELLSEMRAHTDDKEALRVARGELQDARDETKRLLFVVEGLQQQLEDGRCSSVADKTALEEAVARSVSLARELEEMTTSQENARALVEKAEDDQEETEALREELENLRGQARELRLKLRQAHEREQEQRSAIQRLENERDASEGLWEEVGRSQAEAEAARGEAKQATGDLHVALQDASQARKETEKVQADLEKLRGTFKETRADSRLLRRMKDREQDEDVKQLENARGEVRRLTSDLQEAHEQLRDAREQAARRPADGATGSELAMLRGEAAAAQNDSRRAEQEVARAQEETERIREELEKLRSSFKETRADTRRLRRENSQLQEQLQRGSVAEANAANTAPRQELERLRNEAEAARRESQDARAEAQRVIGEVAELQQQLVEARRGAPRGMPRDASRLAERESPEEERSGDERIIRDPPLHPGAQDNAVTWC